MWTWETVPIVVVVVVNFKYDGYVVDKQMNPAASCSRNGTS
jgi:hypothetical protein